MTTKSEAAQWVERASKQTLNDEQARCIDALCALQRPHNIPFIHGHLYHENVEVGPGGDHFTDDDEIPARASLTLLPHGVIARLRNVSLGTYDMDELTRLVIAAHRLCVRIEISAQLYTATDDESYVVDEIWNHEERKYQRLQTDRHPTYTMECLRIMLTARNPEGTSIFDRHPDLDALAKRTGVATPNLERGARRLVTEVWALVDQGVINARSLAADAALDLRDDIDPQWQPERRPVDPTLYPSERLEATAIVDGYLSRRGAPFDGWHFLDNARNDLLREIVKQLIERMWSEAGTADGVTP